jgi:hypothetical protein
MDYRSLAGHLTKFIAHQEEIAGSWNGEDEWYSYGGERYHEDDARTASDLIELAQPLLDQLK